MRGSRRNGLVVRFRNRERPSYDEKDRRDAILDRVLGAGLYSLTRVQDSTGMPKHHISWPYGRSTDIDERADV